MRTRVYISPNQLNVVTDLSNELTARRRCNGPLVSAAHLRARPYEPTGHCRLLDQARMIRSHERDKRLSNHEGLHNQLRLCVRRTKDRTDRQLAVVMRKVSAETYRVLGFKTQFTKTYYRKSNGQTERFNRTVLASLRRFIAIPPDTGT